MDALIGDTLYVFRLSIIEPVFEVAVYGGELGKVTPAADLLTSLVELAEDMSALARGRNRVQTEGRVSHYVLPSCPGADMPAEIRIVFFTAPHSGRPALPG